MTREQQDEEVDREALRETRWLERHHNEWNLTPEDGRSLRQYALDESHELALWTRR